MSNVSVLLLLSFFSLISCATGPVLQPDGLLDPQCNLSVKYLDPETHSFINDDWIVDNWRFDDFNRSYRKKGPLHKGEKLVDLHGDGVFVSREVYLADLELRNPKTAGTIWYRARSLSKNVMDRNLDVFLKNYATRLTSSTFDFRSIDGIIDQKSYAANIVSKTKIEIGNTEALMATIEVADLGRLKLDSTHRLAKVRVIFAKIDYEQTTSQKTSIYEFSDKALLMIGFYSDPEYFEEGLNDFKAFIGRFVIAQKVLKIDFLHPKPNLEPEAKPESPGEAAKEISP